MGHNTGVVHQNVDCAVSGQYLVHRVLYLRLLPNVGVDRQHIGAQLEAVQYRQRVPGDTTMAIFSDRTDSMFFAVESVDIDREQPGTFTLERRDGTDINIIPVNSLIASPAQVFFDSTNNPTVESFRTWVRSAGQVEFELRYFPDFFDLRDDTDGYGPEIYSLGSAPSGEYQIVAHYFGDRGTGQTSATVMVVAREGTDEEMRWRFEVPLTRAGEKVTLAKIDLPPPGMRLGRSPKMKAPIKHEKDAPLPSAR